MLRFLRSPRWLVGHVVVVVAVLGFASLGSWQLSRLDERQAYNDLLAERMAQPPVPLAALTGEDEAAVAYRRVRATGTYLPDQEVLLSTRSHDGRPGHHVLTPLRVDDTVLLVDRGWVPLDQDGPPVGEAPPPHGEVTVEGVLFPSVESRRSGAFDGGSGALEFVSDVDVPVVAQATALPLLPLWLLAAEHVPAQPAGLPVPAEPPVLEEGSHFSYAMQWYLFALVVLVGYPVLLWRSYREARGDRDGAPGEEPLSREPPVPAR